MIQWCKGSFFCDTVYTRAAVGMEIPMGMCMGWACELCWIPLGSVGILWEFSNRCEIKRKRIIVFREPQAAGRSVVVAAAWWRNQSNVQPAAVAGHPWRYFYDFDTVGTATDDNC